jgi:predicted aminopeptidase
MDSYIYILVALSLLLGGLVGYYVRQLVANQQILGTRKEAERLLTEATNRHRELLRDAREEARKVRNAAEVRTKSIACSCSGWRIGLIRRSGHRAQARRCWPP